MATTPKERMTDRLVKLLKEIDKLKLDKKEYVKGANEAIKELEASAKQLSTAIETGDYET